MSHLLQSEPVVAQRPLHMTGQFHLVVAELHDRRAHDDLEICFLRHVQGHGRKGDIHHRSQGRRQPRETAAAGQQYIRVRHHIERMGRIDLRPIDGGRNANEISNRFFQLPNVAVARLLRQDEHPHAVRWKLGGQPLEHGRVPADVGHFFFDIFAIAMKQFVGQAQVSHYRERCRTRRKHVDLRETDLRGVARPIVSRVIPLRSLEVVVCLQQVAVKYDGILATR
mmetsp:Transcript_45105/g.125054  ORF Transcript_45105/g.125054 Transcript_45105/m.125054 type:complete len:225 (-) Transcript_45105:530-1204(-)